MLNLFKHQKIVYQHLNGEERDMMAWMLASGSSQCDIAKELNRSPSTISRELKRNGAPIRDVKYRSHRAQQRADVRKKESHRKQRLNDPVVQGYVIEKLKADYTPEQIAGRIGIDLPGAHTNHESIYLYIYNDRPDLAQYLVWGNRKRRKRSIKTGKRIVKIPNRTMIDKRPEYINDRSEYGHWEADTVVSRQSKSALVVVRERKLQLMFIRKLPRKNANHMNEAVIEILKRIPAKYRKSITFDNGLENAGHEIIARRLNVQTFFCNPYHSWEKGGVENSIGLVRRYFPKKTDFSLISNRKIALVEQRLNNRPRKSLGFRTPLEEYRNCA